MVVAEIIKGSTKTWRDCFATPATKANINIDSFYVSPDGSYYFVRDGAILPKDELIVVTGNVEIGYSTASKRNSVVGTYDYPAFGEYTDYQMDTTIKPSFNAPYDGEYIEPLEEVEVDGVKFVPTTLTIDGVEYKVLAEAQPDEDPVDSTDSELDSTDTELDSTDSEATNGDGE